VKSHDLKRTVGLILVIAANPGVAKALGGESQSGDWTIRRSDVPGKVEFSLMDSRAGTIFIPVRLAGERFLRLGFFEARTPGSSFYDRA